MCGIAGYIGKKEIYGHTLYRTLGLMQNRGPDSQDHKSFKNKNDTNILLLHSRLSIIDLDKRSSQPFTKNNCVITFNGEIYNYIELRNRLVKKGYKFTTSSDTEVLLTSYLEYGEKCVNHFEGMWSFAIYDFNKDKLLLSRDRFAEKPLYYLEDDSGFYFGSETRFIKSLRDKKIPININHILRNITNGHKSLYKTSETFFENIKELPFATNLIIDKDSHKHFTKYWKPEYKPNYDLSQIEIIDGIREKLFRSIELRLRADVPLAFCLSGGIDSSALVSIAKKVFNFDVNTFSIIDSDRRYNEENNIDITTNDINCNTTKIKLDNSIDNFMRLKSLVNYHDAPVITPAYFVHSFISEQISKDGYKIAISGIGADELFTGYYDHYNLHLCELKDNDKFDKILNDWKKYQLKYVRNPSFQNPYLYFNNENKRDHIYLNSAEFRSYLKTEFKENFKEEEYSKSLLRNRMLNELFHEVVRPILHDDDLNSMMFSIENRSPFLDKELFEFIYSVPSVNLINNGYAKYLLRESVKGILNDDVRLEREKKGFNASIFSIFDFKNKKNIDYLLDDSLIYDYFDKAKIKALLEKDILPNSYNKFLFSFINSKIFIDQNS